MTRTGLTSRPKLPLPPETEILESEHAKTVSREVLRKRLGVRSSLKYQTTTGSFGKDAPHFTIGSSRRDFVPPFPSPGPGEYNPADVNAYRRIQHVFPRSQLRDKPSSITANIEMPDLHRFPNIRPFHIGIREKLFYGDIIETPGPYPVPEPKDDRIKHKIALRPVSRDADKTAHLGPGTYDVKYIEKRHEPGYVFSGPSERDRWMTLNAAVPGPGSYNTSNKEMLPNEPKWTIGRKSRLSRRTRNSIPARPKDLLAVGRVIVDLSLIPNAEGSRQYMMTHPQLREIVQEIFDAVFMLKPEDPIEMLENLADQWREELPVKKQKKQNSPQKSE